MMRALPDFLHERLARLPFPVTAEAVLARDVPLGMPGRRSANHSCELLETRDGWIAVNLARAEDAELIPALTGCDGDRWQALAAFARTRDAAACVAAGAELHLPISELGEAEPSVLAAGRGGAAGRRVLDLSVLWAGPLCAGLLARAGAEVRRIENLARPDPTPLASPILDTWLNGAKTRIAVDLTAGAGRARSAEEIALADVIVTNARPAGLARIGIDDALLASRPDLLWVAITAHGWGVDRVGFGDDCAVAGGLVGWQAGEPRFVGDALADPLTGVEAALAAVEAIGNARGGRIDIAMSRVAAAYSRALA